MSTPALWIQPSPALLPHGFSSLHDNSKTNYLRPFKFGMWVHMGEDSMSIVLWPWPLRNRPLKGQNLGFWVYFGPVLNFKKADGLKYHTYDAYICPT